MKVIFLGLHPRAVLRTLRELEAVRPPFAVVKVNQLPLLYQSEHVMGAKIVPSGTPSARVDVPTSARSSATAPVVGGWSSGERLEPSSKKLMSSVLSVVKRKCPAVKSTRMESTGMLPESNAGSVVNRKLRTMVPSPEPLPSPPRSPSSADCGPDGSPGSVVVEAERIASPTSNRG